MFQTEGQEVKGSGLNRTFEPGVIYAHIFSANVRTAKTGKKSLELMLEGPPLTGFEGWAVERDKPEGDKFTGQIAKVSATIYTADFNSDDVNKNTILSKIIVMSDQLGMRIAIDNLAKDGTITSIEQWVDRAVALLKDHDMFWFLQAKEDEYNGKIIIRLSLPAFKFCSADEGKLPKFDKTNKYHYGQFVSTKVDSFEPIQTDFTV